MQHSPQRLRSHAGVLGLCDRLLWNRSIAFGSDDNDIISPLICGAIRADSDSLRGSSSYCVFEQFVSGLLIIHRPRRSAEKQKEEPETTSVSEFRLFKEGQRV